MLTKYFQYLLKSNFALNLKSSHVKVVHILSLDPAEPSYTSEISSVHACERDS